VSRPHSLTEVAAFGLCTGCGLCAGLAPETVKLTMTQDGFLRPRPVQAYDRSEEDRLLRLCPGNHLHVGGGDAPHIDEAWGPYHRLLKGHATDEEMRFRASSGGTISAIANFLLQTKQVDFILHVAADTDAPLRARIQTSRDRAAIVEGASARYGPAAPLETIGDLLALDLPFAVIGKPCDIAGIRNLMREDERAARLIRLVVAFFCAGVSSLRISESIVGKYGLQPDDLKTLRYRGHGCPGATHIEAKDGRVFRQTYDETWSEELNQEIQFRCKICPDGTGEQADIACGDAWIGVDGYAFAEHDGWNSIISRTEKGDRLLREMEAAGSVVTAPITAGDLGRMQPHQVERKQAILGRMAGLALRGQPRPRYRGFRLLANAWSGRQMMWSSLTGTYRRVGRGANREDLRPHDGMPASPQSAEIERPSRRPAWLPGLALLSPALLVMIAGVGVPIALLIAYSFWTQNYITIDHTPTLANYVQLFSRPLYGKLMLRSIGVSLSATVATVVLAYPMAYFIAFHGGKHRTTWLVLVAVPFWTSYLLRTFAWKVILGYEGLINSGLIDLGLITQPLDILLYNSLAVVITLTHAWLPFVMLPIYVSLSKIDPALSEAAADLGDGAFHRFLRVILPLSIPGVISGALLVFIPTVGDYVTPAMVGGTSGTLIGNVIQGQFGRANNWPMGAALSTVVMVIVTVLAIALQSGLTRFRRAAA
jgi:spermidine/putrescine transport system permease protein